MIKLHLYRYTHPNGNQKDWGYPVDTYHASPELKVFHGRTGTRLACRTTSSGACRECSPTQEALMRRDRKLAKGYVYLGEFHLTAQGYVNEKDILGQSPYLWAWFAHDTLSRPFERACHQAYQKLKTSGWPLPEKVVDGTTLWVFFFNTDERGEIDLAERNKVAMATLLMLARAKVGLLVTDRADKCVDQWPVHVPVKEEALIHLGLKPLPVCQLLVTACDDDDDGWYF